MGAEGAGLRKLFGRPSSHVVSHNGLVSWHRQAQARCRALTDAARETTKDADPKKDAPGTPVQAGEASKGVSPQGRPPRSGFGESIDDAHGVSQHRGESQQRPTEPRGCSELAEGRSADGAPAQPLLLVDEMMFVEHVGSVCANGCDNCRLEGIAMYGKNCERSLLFPTVQALLATQKQFQG